MLYPMKCMDFEPQKLLGLPASGNLKFEVNIIHLVLHETHFNNVIIVETRIESYWLPN